jgi:flagellar motility protein MotE (MotC chaperone)
MRLLPMLLLALCGLLVVRLYSIVETGGVLVSHAVAVTEKPAEEKPKDEPKTEKKTEEKESAGDEAKKKEGAKEPTSTTPPTIIPPRSVDDVPLAATSQVEKDLLQSLSKRRDELEEAEKSLALKESILKATEMRIEGKITELRDLKTQVEEKLGEYQKKDEQQILSLVKIYENMKPKDAARIFDEIDKTVLLQVISRMDDRKVAPVLANMSSARAQEITVEIAKQKKLPTPSETDENGDAKPPAALAPPATPKAPKAGN